MKDIKGLLNEAEDSLNSTDTPGVYKDTQYSNIWTADTWDAVKKSNSISVYGRVSDTKQVKIIKGNFPDYKTAEDFILSINGVSK